MLVKQESATEVSSGRNVIDEINKFNDTIYVNQTQLAISILAIHPDCSFAENYILIHADTSAKNLCLSDTEILEWQHNKAIGRKLVLFSASKTALNATDAVVAALSGYLDGLAKFTSDPSHPIADDIQKTLDQLNTTLSTVQQFLPTDVVNEEQAVQPLANSIPNLISFFDGLKKNAQDAASIKAYIKSNAGTVTSLGQTLNDISRNAAKIYGTTYFNNTRLIEDILSGYYNRNKDGKEFADEKNREVFLNRILQQRELANQVKSLQNPLSQAINQFNNSHKHVTDLLDNRLNEADKAKIAAENVKEFNTGLNKFADLAAFALKLAAL
ncbi:MAG: hypothetical protein PHW13_12550 [Methylococcales bacterium]|nr:hypothetical protein [Methylococcales bacterium]